MNMMSSGELKEESISSATYTIVIEDFKKRLAKAIVGEYSVTDEFYVNWSKFCIELYLAGEVRHRRVRDASLSLCLSNRSDWMVRARQEISVKVIMGNV